MVRHRRRASCAMCDRDAIPDDEIGDEIMARSRRHKVFVSYHHQEDQRYKDRFIQMMGDYIVDKSGRYW